LSSEVTSVRDDHLNWRIFWLSLIPLSIIVSANLSKFSSLPNFRKFLRPAAISIGITHQYFSLALGSAFLAGTLIARYLEIDLKKMIGLAFVLIGVFTLIQFIEGMTTGNYNTVLRPIFIAFTFFGGIVLPSTYAFFGRNADMHEQGILYGLLDSFQKLTEWTGSFSLNHFAGTTDQPFAIAKLAVFISFIPIFLTIGLLRTKWFRRETI
jgi:hypothetical protein